MVPQTIWLFCLKLLQIGQFADYLLVTVDVGSFEGIVEKRRTVEVGYDV